MYRVIEMSGRYLGKDLKTTYYRHEAITFETYEDARIMVLRLGRLWNVE
jgi:hypothetical protein